MAYQNRRQVFQEIERKLDLRLITYLTGDRDPVELFATQIGQDVVAKFGFHLRNIGPQRTIGLFIYSRGGDTNVPWRLVTLIRQYCSRFVCLVPFKAHSAATMIVIGADAIYMGPLAEVSPVDPSIRTTDLKGQNINVGVEDVIGFINLAKQKIGLRDQRSSTEILKALSGIVNPVLLGSVNRTHSLIRLYVLRLLELHNRGILGWWKNRRILRYLTEGLYSHSYTIGRNEAKGKIGLKVAIPDADLEDAMSRLFEDYSQEMDLVVPFNPGVTNYTAKRAFIESLAKSDTFLTRYKDFAVTPKGEIQGTIQSEGWA